MIDELKREAVRAERVAGFEEVGSPTFLRRAGTEDRPVPAKRPRLSDRAAGPDDGIVEVSNHR